MKRNPPPRGHVLIAVTLVAVVVVAAIAVAADVSGTSVDSILRDLARLEATTKWGPVPVIDAGLVVVVLVFALATNAFMQLAKLAVQLVAWALRELGYPVSKAPAIPQVALWKACAVPTSLWVISILVIALHS